MSTAMTVTVYAVDRDRASRSAVAISQPARLTSPVSGSVHAAATRVRVTSPKDSAVPTMAVTKMTWSRYKLAA